MTHPGIDTIRAFLADLDLTSGTIDERRAAMESTGVAPDALVGVDVEASTVAGRPAERLVPDGATGTGTVLYLHGGAYCLGSLSTHRGLAATLAVAVGRPVVTLDYRLAPEHPFPAAIDDAVAACEELRSTAGPVALAGDSAGGGLTAATLLALRDRGLALPVAAVCLSPWADLTQSGATYDTADDPVITRALLDECAGHYLAGADPKEPLASPVFGDLAGLPPLLIHVGTDEALLDDATTLAANAAAAGVDASVKVWPEMLHVFQAFPPEVVPEAKGSLDEVAAFLVRHLDAP